MQYLSLQGCRQRSRIYETGSYNEQVTKAHQGNQLCLHTVRSNVIIPSKIAKNKKGTMESKYNYSDFEGKDVWA